MAVSSYFICVSFSKRLFFCLVSHSINRFQTTGVALFTSCLWDIKGKAPASHHACQRSQAVDERGSLRECGCKFNLCLCVCACERVFLLKCEGKMSDVSKYDVCLILFPFYFAICHPHFDKQKAFFFCLFVFSPREVSLHSFYKHAFEFLSFHRPRGLIPEVGNLSRLLKRLFFYGFMCNVSSAALNES